MEELQIENECPRQSEQLVSACPGEIQSPVETSSLFLLSSDSQSIRQGSQAQV